jgi:hypothetical protein
MQVTVQVNKGMIAEHVECGDVMFSGEGVRTEEQGDMTVNVNEDLGVFHIFFHRVKMGYRNDPMKTA